MTTKEAFDRLSECVRNNEDERAIQHIKNEHEQFKKDFIIFIEGIENKLKRFREEIK